MHCSEQMCVTAHVPKKNRIYVVDDEQIIARTLCVILQRSGYEASMFFSAESALEAIQNSAPDLVLSDVMMMGEMDGVELAEVLSETHPLIKVMLISGQGMSSGSLKKANSRGFCPEIWIKPIAPKELLGKIGALLLPRQDKLVYQSCPMGQVALATATA